MSELEWAPGSEDRRSLLLRYAELVESLHGTYVTAADMNTSSAEMDVISNLGKGDDDDIEHGGFNIMDDMEAADSAPIRKLLNMVIDFLIGKIVQQATIWVTGGTSDRGPIRPDEMLSSASWVELLKSGAVLDPVDARQLGAEVHVDPRPIRRELGEPHPRRLLHTGQAPVAEL